MTQARTLAKKRERTGAVQRKDALTTTLTESRFPLFVCKNIRRISASVSCRFHGARKLSRRCHVRTSLKASLLGTLLLNISLAASVYGDWKQDWEKSVAAAEKEGEVTIYGQSRAGVGKALLAFKDAYPKIKINFVGGSGSDLAKKVMAEKRASKHLVDLSVGGGGTMVPRLP